MKRIVRGGRCVTADGVVRADLGIEGGRIVALAAGLDVAGAEVLDATDCLVFPGGVDVHCHLPWPSGDVISGDDVESGTRAAIHGGVTTVLDFVIPELGESLTHAVERKLAETQDRLYCDYSAHVCVREVNNERLAEIPALVERGFTSFKIFMAYEGFRLEDRDVLRVMQAVKAAGGIVSVHAENGLLADRATANLLDAGQRAVQYYGESRPAYCEHEAIDRILHYAAAIDVPLHVHHVSTGPGAQAIAAARRRGQHVSGETCPQYMLFTDDAYRAEGVEATYLVIAPPLRKAKDRVSLWDALDQDALSAVATDHCPYTLAQKRAGVDDFTLVPGGTAGVETRWPLLFTHALRTGRLAPERLAQVWAANPARIFGLYPRKAGLRIGGDADVIIVQPERESVLSAGSLHMQTDCVPYEGWRVYGFPLTTLLRGEIVVRDGELVSAPGGQVVPRTAPQRVGALGRQLTCPL